MIIKNKNISKSELPSKKLIRNKKNPNIDFSILSAFTLVELIVVITILAILGTIAFISLQGFSRDARNASRGTDLKSIETIVGLYHLKEGRFPSPSNGEQITYSGSEVWTQGTFGEDTRKLLGSQGQISEVPKDPLTGSEYTYSVVNTGQEMSIAGVFEGDYYGYNNSHLASSIGRELYASGDEYGTSYIKGNYNGKVVRVQSGSTTYVLAVPSIISGDETLIDLVDIINAKKLVYSKSNIIPSSYSGQGSFHEKLPEENIVNSGTLLIYETTDINSLKNEGEQEKFIANLKTAYVSTAVDNQQPIKTILDNPTLFIAQTIIHHEIDSNVVISAKQTYAPGAFVSTWDVGIDEGVSGFNKIKLPLQSNGTYDFYVNWGDGASEPEHITVYDQEEVTHDYGKAGIYNVIISGNIDGFSFKSGNPTVDNTNDGDKLIDIKQWGNVKIADGGLQFASMDNLVYFSASDIPDLSNVTNFLGTFAFSVKFNGNINNWDTSNVTNMSRMFYAANNFNQSLNNWNVSKVENMVLMFYDANKFNGNISNWNTSKVTNMNSMFSGIPSKKTKTVFNQNINNWDVSKVEDMSLMFYNNVAFNKPLNNWDTSKVKTMRWMLGSYDYETQFNQNINNWNVSEVLNMSDMFVNSRNFNQPLNNWNISKVEDLSGMFGYLENFNQPLDNWNTSSVTNMDHMFYGASIFDQDISGWNMDGNPTHDEFDFDTSTSWTSAEKPVWP